MNTSRHISTFIAAHSVWSELPAHAGRAGSKHSPRGRATAFLRALLGLGVLAAGWIFCAAAATPVAQGGQPSEADVEAAYLYNFGKFVDWPEEAVDSGAASFVICVLGQDKFGAALDSVVAKQTLDGRGVIARRISKAEEAGDCRILFISSSESKQLKNILRALDKEAVLTVSDLPEFTQRGGMIAFVSQDDKVRFEVNVANAESRGLTLSSELLKVAVSVRRTQSGD